MTAGGRGCTPLYPPNTQHPKPNADRRLLVLATPRVQPTLQLTLYFPISWLPPRPFLFPFSISLLTKQALSQHKKNANGKIAALII